MRYGGGLVIGPIAVAVLWSLWPGPKLTSATRPLYSSLLTSLLLFFAGGLIGFMISGNNVRIPAHYHGCIVGVTLAMMGMVYRLLPQLGYQTPTGPSAFWQPIVYGTGQLLHIIGLVWSGGYGVQRKVADADQVLRSSQEIWGMGLMGFGGLVAIVGGILFLFIVLRCLRHPSAEV
jgi:heme/copper-type cytochrome/quinol oxidase subunit 1